MSSQQTVHLWLLFGVSLLPFCFDFAFNQQNCQYKWIYQMAIQLDKCPILMVSLDDCFQFPSAPPLKVLQISLQYFPSIIPLWSLDVCTRWLLHGKPYLSIQRESLCDLNDAQLSFQYLDIRQLINSCFCIWKYSTPY